MGLSLQERFQQGCLVAESQSSKKTHIEVSGRCKNVNTHFYTGHFFIEQRTKEKENKRVRVDWFSLGCFSLFIVIQLP